MMTAAVKLQVEIITHKIHKTRNHHQIKMKSSLLLLSAFLALASGHYIAEEPESKYTIDLSLRACHGMNMLIKAI